MREYAVNLAQQMQSDRSTADVTLKDFIFKNPQTLGHFRSLWCTQLAKSLTRMFKWLDTAYAMHDSGLTQLAVMPFFLPYRDDPRFTALCQKLNVQVPAMSAKP